MANTFVRDWERFTGWLAARLGRGGLPLWGAVAAGLALKGALEVGGAIPFNADEAIVALMGRHILQGARPIFFYGQAYMGSLDAWLVAGGFALLGGHVWVIRLMQALLYAGVIWTTYHLALELGTSRQSAWLAAWLMAIPPVTLTLYTTASLGGYGEALLIGNLLLIDALRIAKVMAAGDDKRLGQRIAAWGALAGLGLWAFGLTLVYSIPGGVYLAFAAGRSRGGLHRMAGWLAAAGLGFSIGAAPWLLYAAQNGLGALLGELRGGAIAGVEGVGFVESAARHALNYALFGLTALLGLRPAWEMRLLVLPLAPLALAFWLAVSGYSASRLRRLWGRFHPAWLLVGVALTFTLAFILSPFGADPSGRYFLPLWMPAALAAAAFVGWLGRRYGSRLAWLVLLPLAYQLAGTLESALANPPGLTTQFDAAARVDLGALDELQAFLVEQGETRGYTTYWMAYPLAFHSQERLIFIPALPYHEDLRFTERDNRYAPYAALVASAPRTAYITASHALLDERLRAGFRRLGVTWSEREIGGLRVFYGLSRLVKVEEVRDW